MSSSIRIRVAVADDFEELAPLVTASQLYQKKELEGKILDDESAFVKQERETVKKWLDDNSKVYIMALDSKEKIVGFTLLFDDRVSQQGTIHDLYVTDTMRGHGIATELIARAEQWFKAQNINRVVLAVLKTNRAAMKVYEKTGFLPYEDNYVYLRKNIQK